MIKNKKTETRGKFGIEENHLNLIKQTLKKPIGGIASHGDTVNDFFPLRSGPDKDTFSHHCYSV